MSYDVVRLTLADLPGCLALAADRDWLDEPGKWRFLFAVGEVYGIRDGGELVGTTILTRYGSGMAAISMVLVAARLGGRGLGRRLMEHALAQAGTATVILDATAQGRPLYEKLGFTALGTRHVHAGVFDPGADAAAATVSRAATAADLPAITRLDTRAMGAERTGVMRLLPEFSSSLRVIERDGEVTGFAGAWPNTDRLMVGPVVAGSDADALALITETVGGTDERVRVDFDERRPHLREWATAHGLAERFTCTIMAYGPARGDRAIHYSPLMQALG
ncbi:GNAT family N-acetyltransferase [Catellatospora sp. KI3]|uniref:GNAT family N-acetyltransferase n=1 Tax=Catellatospora sp. KI3 TaxID=3041620 RepID=UPI002482E037|nr:GNAT family N-acetyltransferase [Catellatospora sp. KI3]MDI1462990.1 GNAT family N-acetyltransferase [Catellatospora sp. KI3]